MPSLHSIRAALVAVGVAMPLSGSAQPPPSQTPPASGASTFAIFLRGAQIFRVHNVRAAVQSLRMLEAVEGHG